MDSEYFKYTKTDRIHRFVMYRADQEAVEAYFAVRHDILATTREDEPCLLIVDCTQTGFELIYFTVSKSISLLKQFKSKRLHRILIIYADMSQAYTASLALKLNPFINVKFIQPHEEGAYTNWLLTGQLPYNNAETL